MDADTFATVGGEGLGDVSALRARFAHVLRDGGGASGHSGALAAHSLISVSKIPAVAIVDRTANPDGAARTIADARFGFRE